MARFVVSALVTAASLLSLAVGGVNVGQIGLGVTVH